MLRLTGGFGYATMSTEIATFEMELNGVAAYLAVDVGGSLVENLVLHGRFSLLSVAQPTASIDGEDFGTRDDSSMMQMMFGPALTYYVMPANLYFTGAFGLAMGAISYEDRTGAIRTGATDLGFGLNVDVGWEFWIGRSWGIGPALRAFYISVPDDVDGDDPPVWQGLGFGVLFSGTFQ